VSDNCAAGDELYLGPTEDGRTTALRHHADHTLQPCSLLPLQDGKPIPPGAELVQLQQRPNGAYAVTSIYKSAGPAKVTTDEYRAGWDRVFAPRPRGEA